MANGIRTVDLRGFNKGRSSKFRVGSWIRSLFKPWAVWFTAILNNIKAYFVLEEIFFLTIDQTMLNLLL